MIIRRLTLYNFGVYAGTNVFEFANRKPIVLIAGMNGRGKTTFLEAVLLALYGSNSFAYQESVYKSYGMYLKSFVNRQSWTQKASVELEFSMDAEANEIYIIRREWSALNKRTKEEVYVEKNGDKDEFLIKNWSMFIENVLPSALANFFFFDGEKIAELAIDSTNEQLKESIRAMLGLSVIDLLQRDIGRNISRLSRLTFTKKEQKELDSLREIKERNEVSLDKKVSEIEKLQAKLVKVESELSSLREEYASAGGTAFEERQKLEQKRSEVNIQLEQNRSMLFDVSASELPLCMVKGLLSEIESQSVKEHESSIMRQTITNMGELYKKFDADDDEKKSISRFMDFVKEKTNEQSVEVIYSLSNHGILQVEELLSGGLESVKQNTERLLSAENGIQQELDRLDSYLAADIDEGEIRGIYKRLQRKLQIKYDLAFRIEVKQQEKKTIEWNLSKSISDYQRAVEHMLSVMETTDDNEREIQYSHMAEQILKEFAIRLQKQKVIRLACTITECYKRLANKKNLIHVIDMNPKTLEITYLDEKKNVVPKTSLSAGEKQLMVISILWALAICSKKKLPVIIDTPLSRLDSAHRTSLITTYFPNASDQTIILSTDSEIDQKYYDLMKNNVGDEFTLKYDDKSKCTHIQRGYFQEDSTL